MVQSPALERIITLLEEVKEDKFKNNKSAARRMRVALSEIAKLCRQSRKEIQECVKGEAKRSP